MNQPASQRDKTRLCWFASVFAICGTVFVVWLIRSSMEASSIDAASAVCMLLVVSCAVTDFIWHKIFNWATYPAALAGLLINLSSTIRDAFSPSVDVSSLPQLDWLGAIGFGQSMLGFLACFALGLISLSMAQAGAGDIKLAGCMGAFLGLRSGFLAIAYSFIAAGVFVLCWIIWQHGLRRVGWEFYAWSMHRAGGGRGKDFVSDERLLTQPVPLGVFYIIGVPLVMLGV